jgi:hypothetical protein
MYDMLWKVVCLQCADGIVVWIYDIMSEALLWLSVQETMHYSR